MGVGGSKDGSDGSEGSEGKEGSEGREGKIGGPDVHQVFPQMDYNTFEGLADIGRPNVTPLNPMNTFSL